MKKPVQATLEVQGTPIRILSHGDDDYLCLTDISQRFGDEALIHNWMRNRNVLELLAVWERLHNPSFKGVEFDTFKAQSGLNTFKMTPRKWIDGTSAIGVSSRSGRNGGTYAHKDLALEFLTWLSPEFKLLVLKEFQRLKVEEHARGAMDWNLNRAMARSNYRIHTDAIKENIVPTLTPEQQKYVYANEADMLNVALFGMTAKQWREANPSKDGNIRDDATVEQLLVLVNLESLNAEFIVMGMSTPDRLQRLNLAATRQLLSLTTDRTPTLPGSAGELSLSN